MRSWLSIVLIALGGLVIYACSGAGSDGPPFGGGGTGGVILDCATLTNPPSDCDKSCTSDSECTASFCENNTKCVAQCTATEGCGGGSTCNLRGRCIPDIGTGGMGGTGGGNACQSVTITPSRSIPNVMFLVDQSGSMIQPFGGGDRWEAAHTAITSIISQLDSIVRFGLTTYQSANGGSTPDECPIFDTQVDFAMDNFGPINMSFPASFPGGEDTPTGDSIDVLVDIIQADPPPTEGPTIIVLATDGEPDTCEIPDNNEAEGRREALLAAEAAHSAGFDLFMLSVGTAVGQEHLKAMANLGIGLDQNLGLPLPGGEDPDNPSEGAPFWVGDNPQSLEDAFNAIISASISCDIQMDRRFDDVDKACAEGDVRLNGSPLDCPTEWRVKPEVDDVIELVGSACDTLKSGDVTFSAVFPCGAIVVE
jgi:hypothetical protein